MRTQYTNQKLLLSEHYMYANVIFICIRRTLKSN